MVRTLGHTLEKKRDQARHLPTHKAKLRRRLCLRRWQRLRAKAFCETVGDVQAVSLLNTMHYGLAEMKA